LLGGGGAAFVLVCALATLKARFGGDEFTLLLENLSDEHDAARAPPTAPPTTTLESDAPRFRFRPASALCKVIRRMTGLSKICW